MTFKIITTKTKKKLTYIAISDKIIAIFILLMHILFPLQNI